MRKGTFDKVSFGQRLRARRLELGLSERKVAESIGMTEESYKHLEYGNNGPSVEKLMRIGNALDISIDYLVYGSKETEGVSEDKRYIIDKIVKVIINCTPNHLENIYQMLRYHLIATKQK